MTLPTDAQILRDPDEYRPEPEMVECETCAGNGVIWGSLLGDPCGRYDCLECHGTGEVPAEPDEPDGDYRYEQARDRRMEE